MIHFKRVLDGIDVQPLLAQIKDHPELWNQDDSWTRSKPPEVVVNGIDVIVLRYNGATPAGYPQNWDKPASHILTAALPIVFDVMRAIPGEHLGKILITRLRPGDQIKPHIHQTPPIAVPGPFGEAPRWPHYYKRYQIPLDVHPGCLFVCGEEELYMEPGTAWAFDDTSTVFEHAVFNNSDQDRISMLADIRPYGGVT